MPIEIKVAPVGKNDPTLDLQTKNIFGVNGEAKINKFLDYIEILVIGRNMECNTPNVRTCRQHTLGFALLYCQTYVNRLAFNSTKAGISSNISLDMLQDSSIL